MSALRAISEWEKQDINMRSVSTAKLASSVVSAFSSSKNKGGNEVKLEHFLPFSIESKDSEETETTTKPTSETKRVIKKLIKNGELPPPVIAMFIKDVQS